MSGISTSLTSAVGGIAPLRIGGVSGTSTSLTSAVGGLAPLMIGGGGGGGSRQGEGPVRLYSGKKHVPLQGSALQPQTRTAPVHKTGRVRGGLPQTARAEIVLLPGRLASGGRIPGLAVPTAALSSPDCAGLRLSNKLGEIGASAYTAPDLPRSRQ